MKAYDTFEEHELAERLERLGSTTRFDPDALQRIVARGQGERDGRPGRRVMMAGAAVALLVGGLAVALARNGQDDGTTDRSIGPAGSSDSSDSVPSLTLQSDPYAVEVVWSGGELYFRRTDGVGNIVSEGPDKAGARKVSSWPGVKGPTCLTSDGGFFLFPDHKLDPRAFTYGLVGEGIAKVDVVNFDGTRAHATIGAAVPGGFRMWLVERISLPNIEDIVDRIEAFDANGKVVAQVADVGELTDNGIAPTCRG
jgi:hypothetical protein